MTDRLARLLDDDDDGTRLEPSPGAWHADDLALRWTSDAITVSRGADTQHIACEGLAVQLSRAHLAPEPRGWRRLLGITPAPVPHLVVELRPSNGARVMLVAPSTSAALDRLPHLQTLGERVPEGPLLALLATAMTGGARLVQLPAPARDDPAHTAPADALTRRAGPLYWLSVLALVAIALAALPLSLPYALAQLEHWGGSRLVEGYAPLLAAVAPCPALAWSWWRSGRRTAATWIIPVALAPLLFFSFVMAANALFDGTLRPGSALDWLDFDVDRLEYCVGLVAFHAATLTLAGRLPCWHTLTVTATTVVTERAWGWSRRQVRRDERAAVVDLVLDPTMRYVRDSALVEALVPASPLPPDLEAPTGERRRHDVRPGEDGRWYVELRSRGWRLFGAGLCAMGAILGLALARNGDARGHVLAAATGLGALVLGKVSPRAVIDPHLGAVIVYDTLRRGGDKVRTTNPRSVERIRAPSPANWRRGVAAQHFAGLRIRPVLEEWVRLELVARPDAPPRAHRLARELVFVSVRPEEAELDADTINRAMAHHGWTHTA